MGDPEAQAILARFTSDLVEVILSALAGQLEGQSLAWDPRVALCIVMASGGYPGLVKPGLVITGLEHTSPDVIVFHAGTGLGTGPQQGKVVTQGGRVLGVTALGKDLPAARRRGYEAIAKIHWTGVHYRKDLGLKEGSV